MKIKTRGIVIIILAVLAAAAIFSAAAGLFSEYRSPTKNIAGTLKSYSKTLSINNITVPGYICNDVPYIVADDLENFGLTVSKGENTLSISSDSAYAVTVDDAELTLLDAGKDYYYTDYTVSVQDTQISAYEAQGHILIPFAALKVFGAVNESDDTMYCVFGDFTYTAAENAESEESSETDGAAATFDPSVVVDMAGNTSGSLGGSSESSGKIIVLDPGHGLSSSEMSSTDKENSGWVYNSDTGGWGEWRHFKSGTVWQDCEGYGCSGRVTPNGACWYAIGDGDRDTEPEINLNNCLAAKQYLEQLGYTVRLTRSSNSENPSITRRLTYCYPNNDTSAEPDALLFVCIHSNAGGGSGSSYIALEGLYDQAGIPDDYVEGSNTLGKYINDEIASNTSLGANSPITSEPELIAFCKSPVYCGYLEIGFYDDSSDLSILRSESDAIGNAIAQGIDSFVKEYLGK